MAAHGEIDVVVVESVARRAIDEGSRGGQDLFTTTDQRRGPFGTVVLRLAHQDVGQFLLCAGDGDGEPVEQALLGALDEIVRQIAPGEGGSATGKFGGDGNGLHAASCDHPTKVSDTSRRIVHRRCRMVERTPTSRHRNSGLSFEEKN
jgi:hypothetical protein